MYIRDLSITNMKNCGIHALETQLTFIITNINFYIVADM